MLIVDGNQIAEQLLSKLFAQILRLKKCGIYPKVACLKANSDLSTASYLKKIKQTFKRLGIILELVEFDPLLAIEDQFLEKLNYYNDEVKVHGIMIAFPLHSSFNQKRIINKIDPAKDIEGIHPFNLGSLVGWSDFPILIPPTSKAVLLLLDYFGISLQGKAITLIGHSNAVGKPLALSLLNRNATLTICHIYTNNLIKYTKNADIIISATGKAGLITEPMVKKDVIAIDLGYFKKKDLFYGDFDFENVKKKAKLITPVPNGTGPITVACLADNVLNVIRAK